MRDRDAALRERGLVPRQFPSDEAIGQAVEAVAPDALVVHRARKGEAAHNIDMGPVESRVEGRRLRQLRAQPVDRADKSEPLRLMRVLACNEKSWPCGE